MKTAVVKQLSDELNSAIEIKRALAEHSEDTQLLLDMIEGSSNLPEAIMAVYESTLEDQVLVEGLKAKLAELGERKSRLEHSIETRRGLLLMAMDKVGLQQLKGPLATISTREVPGKLVISDESIIPAKFFIPQDPELDKKALLKAVRAGEEIPGANLSNGTLGLTIRVR